MTERLKLAAGVRAEIREAAGWYAEPDRKMGAKVVPAVDEAIRRVVQWSAAGSPLERVDAAWREG